MLRKLARAVEVGVQAALQTVVEKQAGPVTPVLTGAVNIEQIDIRGLRFNAERTDDPFIPVSGVLLLKGIREHSDGPVFRELYTDDLSVMERIGMCVSAADTWRDWTVRTQRPGG